MTAPQPAHAGSRRVRARVGGTVQGVGFRPYVYRLAAKLSLSGYVLNDERGVLVEIEGEPATVERFLERLPLEAPPFARVDQVWREELPPTGAAGFQIIASQRVGTPAVPVSPDLATCAECLAELFDPADRRFHYPYINCTNCGPRFSILLRLPYDRPSTTMNRWPMCADCAREFNDPADRRFHAQPVACPACGPNYTLIVGGEPVGSADDVVSAAVNLLQQGCILALKGLGGYHLACDAECDSAVRALRERKFRKEKPFALMAANLAVVRSLVELSPEAEALMSSGIRPIVVSPARIELPGVAPDNPDLGVMLPYTPLHYLLFAAGAPRVLVMTSANRSSEPIAYRDEDALDRLTGLADGFLVGQRPIARRVDDSVVQPGRSQGRVLRRARGHAPGSVARLTPGNPVLALGADLKNAITLVVNGVAIMSQHVGDLEHYEAYQSFSETVRDLTAMYEVDWSALTVAHDLHPQYVSTRFALRLEAPHRRAVQHHRAHVVSVLAERGELHRRVLGVAFDGTGYGDDGTIWGGEFFAGDASGLARVAHLRPALLPGGDAAARFPVQAAAGFLHRLDGLPDLTAAPFRFPPRYRRSTDLVERGLRTFSTTSAGRLFDTVAALAGFTREASFEGQPAIWLEHLARRSNESRTYPLEFSAGELDYRPLLQAVIRDRRNGVDPGDIARAFHRGLARGIGQTICTLCDRYRVEIAVLSGGVFQNQLLLDELMTALERSPVRIWTNRTVPVNDGGISLGQAAIAQLEMLRAGGG